MKRVIWLRIPEGLGLSLILVFAALGLVLSLGGQLSPAITVQSGAKISRLGQMLLDLLDFVHFGL
ncbi:MAG: hypothetical protein FH749_05100 [Firmicutes bacterium]|nr:hypothetical protein [Bacillota bacterium]